MPNPFKPIANLPKDVSESVLKPAVSEVGKMVKEGVQGVFGQTATATPADPQVEAKRKAEEEKRRQNILRYFEALKANAQAYKQQQDYLKQQKKQEEIAEEQKVRQFQIEQKQKRQQSVEVFRAQRKAEIKIKGG